MTDEAAPQPGAPVSQPVPSPYPPSPYASGYPGPGYGAPGAYPPGAYPPGAYPPGAYPPRGSYGGGADVPPPERKRRGWVIAVVLLLVFGVIGGCVAMIAVLASDTGSSAEWGTGFGDAVAVIRIDGVISGTGGSGTVTPERIMRQLDEVANDDSVKAIVLRVDSPGGTVAASEEIAGLIKREKKPVVVSIGDAGASGAYMVSSQADLIYAMPGSTVGSIGVIAEVPNIEGLLKKLGVQFVIITAGKYKGAGNPYEPLTPEERKLLQQDVDIVYNQFIDIVAVGRKMSRAEVEKLANGWAWPGTKAKELGLVDRIGGLSEAVDEAAKRGGIKGEPRIVEYPEYDPTQLLQSLFSGSGAKLPIDGLQQALPK
jgi:protease-4